MSRASRGKSMFECLKPVNVILFGKKIFIDVIKNFEIYSCTSGWALNAIEQGVFIRRGKENTGRG